MFDETGIILGNPILHGLGHIPEIFRSDFFNLKDDPIRSYGLLYYRPLTALSFAVNFHFGKVDPFGYNATNLFLHVAVCLLLYGFLVALFRNWIAALCATLFYALSPAHTESVTYLSSRGDILNGLCVLLGLWTYRKRKYFLTALVYLAAVLSKEIGLLLPLYLLAWDWSFERSRPKELFRRLWPCFLTGVAYLLFRIFVLQFPAGSSDFHLKDALLRFFSMGGPVLDYFRSLLLPETFKLCLSVDFASGWIDSKVWTSLVVYGCLLCAFWIAARHKGPALLGWCVFFIGLAPFMQLVHFHAEWAEHYLYTPAIGLAILSASGITFILTRLSKKWRVVFFFLFCPYLFFLGHVTWQRNDLYNDPEKFYSRLAASDSPYAAYGYQNLGSLALDEKRFAEAVFWTRKAIALDPYSEINYSNLGVCYLRLRDYPSAFRAFKTAYKLHTAKEKGGVGYLTRMGNVEGLMGRYRIALRLYEKALSRKPFYAPASRQLLSTYEILGRPEKAYSLIEQWLSLPYKDEDKAAWIAWRLRSFYRAGRLSDLLRDLALLKRYSKIGWYRDVVALFEGRLSPEAFIENNAMLPEEAREVVLMALVVQGKTAELRIQLQQNRDVFSDKAAQSSLFTKELLIAEAAV